MSETEWEFWRSPMDWSWIFKKERSGPNFLRIEKGLTYITCFNFI